MKDYYLSVAGCRKSLGQRVGSYDAGLSSRVDSYSGLEEVRRSIQEIQYGKSLEWMCYGTASGQNPGYGLEPKYTRRRAVRVRPDAKNRPFARWCSGRFEVSLWKTQRLVKGRNTFHADSVVDVVRACVQHHRFNRFDRTYRNQRIWCDGPELRGLLQVVRDVLDQLREEQR